MLLLLTLTAVYRVCSLLFIVSVRWLIMLNSHTVHAFQVPVRKRAVFRHCSGDNVESDYLRVLTLRLVMSYIYIYIYIYGVPILDGSRSHTTTQHSR